MNPYKCDLFNNLWLIKPWFNTMPDFDFYNDQNLEDPNNRFDTEVNLFKICLQHWSLFQLNNTAGYDI